MGTSGDGNLQYRRRWRARLRSSASQWGNGGRNRRAKGKEESQGLHYAIQRFSPKVSYWNVNECF
jgi:hypothetical protein